MILSQADPHYKLILAFYGERRAKRSGVRLMNHIDEGLVILSSLNASQDAQRAFCLHPIVQGDDDMRRALQPESLLNSHPIGLVPLALAIEYRVVANAYLSNKPVPSQLENILLSSLPEVNAMLVADKVQNRKDFEMHHKGTHDRSHELEAYFEAWLERLGVSEQRYRTLAKLAETA